MRGVWRGPRLPARPAATRRGHDLPLGHRRGPASPCERVPAAVSSSYDAQRRPSVPTACSRIQYEARGVRRFAPPLCAMRVVALRAVSAGVAPRCLQPHATLPAARARPLARAARCRALRCAAGDGSGAADGDSPAAAPPPWGVGFSAAGLLFPYYVGVSETLQRHGVLTGAQGDNTEQPPPLRRSPHARRHHAVGGRIRRLSHCRRARQRAPDTRGAPRRSAASFASRRES